MDLRFDASLSIAYHAGSQVTRVLTEDWVSRELACLSCAEPDLRPTARNTKSRDFECSRCDEPYELKATAGRFTSTVLDGEYHTLLNTLASGRAPNLLLMEYDKPELLVRNLVAIHRSLLSPSCVIPRKAPLSPGARRAGWLGCSISLERLPVAARIPVVTNHLARPQLEILADWKRFSFMVPLAIGSRGWLADVLACAEKAGARDSFSLDDIYEFEAELSRLHPGNRNVRAKIRQQLQVLVARGALGRVEPGVYVRRPAGGSPSCASS